MNEGNIVAVYTDDAYDNDALASIVLVFNCNKTLLRNYIKEMLRQNVKDGDEEYVDVARNIDGAQTLEKFLKKKNIKSVRLDGLADNGLSIVDIAENMPDLNP